jgi:hypothetical protein
MARRNDTAGCGCLVMFFVVPIVVGFVVAIPGMILAAPAITTYLLVEDPKQIAAYPSWWIGVALAPLAAYLLVRVASRGRAHPRHRIHLIRAGILAASCAAAALVALYLDHRYAGGHLARTNPRAGSFELPLVAPAVAAAVALLGYGIVRLLDRKVPMRQRVVPRPRVAPPSHDPQPGEIWWGEVEFRQGDGAKDRPFLVLRTHPTQLEILQITSQDKSDRADHIPFWAESDDPYAVTDGWLELRVRVFDRSDLRRQDPSHCPDRIWYRVRSMAPVDA